MTNNKPHVRSYFTSEVYQEVIREHNNRLDDLYNPKAINISYLFLKLNYCKFYIYCRYSHHSYILCRKIWFSCSIYNRNK